MSNFIKDNAKNLQLSDKTILGQGTVQCPTQFFKLRARRGFAAGHWPGPCTAFAVYHSQTAPLIDWYKAEGLHHYVKSYGVLEEIFADVCKVVDSL